MSLAEPCQNPNVTVPVENFAQPTAPSPAQPGQSLSHLTWSSVLCWSVCVCHFPGELFQKPAATESNRKVTTIPKTSHILIISSRQTALFQVEKFFQSFRSGIQQQQIQLFNRTYLAGLCWAEHTYTGRKLLPAILSSNAESLLKPHAAPNPFVPQLMEVVLYGSSIAGAVFSSSEERGRLKWFEEL